MTRAITSSALIATLSLVLVACGSGGPPSQAGLPPLPPADVTFIGENTGQLCLEPYYSLVRPVWYPTGATEGCSEEVQRLGDVRIDERARTIRFYTRHVYIDPLGPRSTHTCVAAGYAFVPMPFDFVGGTMQHGTYAVWWGDSKVGEIRIGQVPPISQTICVSRH